MIEPESRNRDIMLCLDVSGSMYEADSEILRVYAELSKGFKGERIGLVLFDSSPVVVFPLTDDYDFVTKQLESAAEAFKYSFSGKYNSEKTKRIYDLISGVYEGDGSYTPLIKSYMRIYDLISGVYEPSPSYTPLIKSYMRFVFSELYLPLKEYLNASAADSSCFVTKS